MEIYYRCIFQFTDEKYKSTPASNIFMRDGKGVLGKDFILARATEHFKNSLAEKGLSDLVFKAEIFQVSEAEVEQYRAHQNQRTTRSMN